MGQYDFGIAPNKTGTKNGSNESVKTLISNFTNKD